MQRKLIRFVSVLLLSVAVFNGIAFTSRESYAAVTPQRVVDAIDKFATAVGKIAAKDASKTIGDIANFCSRLSGLTSAVSGVIGILQMAGIIQDPTLEMLGDILDAVKDVQTALTEMNHTLNDIVAKLIAVQAAQLEIDRNQEAQTMSTNWNNFNTSYTEKLQTYVSEYQAKINTGIFDWWNQASHEGVYVLMTKKYSEKNSLTYSKKKYSEGLPAASDIQYVIASTDETVTEKVNAEWSIGIPADYMPDTSAVAFNIETYRDDFKKIMITALENAIKDGKLASDCGASVISEYSTSSKDVMLESYANNVLNTVIYKIACDVMTENNSWVSQVISLYEHYCENILKQNSGINAFLNHIFLTHTFEGQVSGDIVRFLDGMTAQVGFYGSFAMTCAGQDSLQTTADKEQIREYFANTVLSLDNKRAKAITGKDNYCYITGTVLEADTTSLSSSMSSSIYKRSYGYGDLITGYRYEGCNIRPWEITVPSIVDSVFMQIIYHQYEAFQYNDSPYKANSFGEYLYKYGAQADSGNKTYMTNYSEVQTFAFSEGIHMRATALIEESNYFNNGEWYNIDVGTGSKVEQEYYHCHDKVIGDLFDSSNGGQTVNTIIAARAFYGESYWSWFNDEIWAFCSESVDMKTEYSCLPEDAKLFTTITCTNSLTKSVEILKRIPCHDSNDVANDPDNPFFAFNKVSLPEGVYNNNSQQSEPVGKEITEILLDSESFPYTGQPIEPAVTVFASDDIVPEDGYTVTYLNNIESGDYGFVKVEGKGDYTGTIVRHFMITSGSSSSQIQILNSSSSGCNAMGGLCAAFGLAFVMRKFRRR